MTEPKHDRGSFAPHVPCNCTACELRHGDQADPEHDELEQLRGEVAELKHLVNRKMGTILDLRAERDAALAACDSFEANSEEASEVFEVLYAAGLIPAVKPGPRLAEVVAAALAAAAEARRELASVTAERDRFDHQRTVYLNERNDRQKEVKRLREILEQEVDTLTKFSAEREREACAKVADSFEADAQAHPRQNADTQLGADVASNIAAAIRARGGG